MYDEWVDHDPANGELAVTRLRAVARPSPAAALCCVLDEDGDHGAARDVAEWLATNELIEHPGSKKPVRGPHGTGGAGTSHARGSRA